MDFKEVKEMKTEGKKKKKSFNEAHRWLWEFTPKENL